MSHPAVEIVAAEYGPDAKATRVPYVDSRTVHHIMRRLNAKREGGKRWALVMMEGIWIPDWGIGDALDALARKHPGCR